MMPGLSFGEVVDEAAEQAGLDPATLTARHLNSMTRSLFLLFTEIENKGLEPEYRMGTESFTLAAGQGAVVMPADTIDVVGVTYRTPQQGNTADVSFDRTHRNEWLSLANRTQTGRPTTFFMSKTLPAEVSLIAGGVTIPTDDPKLLVLWPRNDAAGAVITVNRLRETAMPSGLLGAVDARREWLNTICVGLGAYTAKKYNIARYDRLKGEFDVMLRERQQSQNKGSVYVAFRGHGFSRRRRH